MNPTLRIAAELDPCPCRPALVWATGVSSAVSQDLRPELIHLQASAREPEAFWLKGTQVSVRNMLRHGCYKPNGRSKPASEFLLKAALNRRFPAINAPVDANNAVSLASGLPGSIFDAELSTSDLVLRRGYRSENYVFNPAGQVIELQDLLLVAKGSDDVACGNPVKDSMLTKTHPETESVLAVLYAPFDYPSSELERWAQQYTEYLKRWCGASQAGFLVVEKKDS